MISIYKTVYITYNEPRKNKEKSWLETSKAFIAKLEKYISDLDIFDILNEYNFNLHNVGFTIVSDPNRNIHDEYTTVFRIDCEDVENVNNIKKFVDNKLILPYCNDWKDWWEDANIKGECISNTDYCLI